MFAREIKQSGADHITIVTPHSNAGVEQIREHFGKNVELIKASDLFIEHIKKQYEGKLDKLSIGAPDGHNKPNDQAVNRAKKIAQAIYGDDWQSHFFSIEKERLGPGRAIIKQAHGAYSEWIVS